MNTRINKIVYNVMLLSMLHSSLVAPAQDMVYAYFNREEGVRYKGFKKAEEQYPVLDNHQQEEAEMHQNPAYSQPVKSGIPVMEEMMESDIKHGFIGATTEKPLDDATDNIFKVMVNSMPDQQSKVYLVYELYGLQDYRGVSRSINDRLSTGGHIIKNQQGWTLQKEEIDAAWLKQGENRIMFSIPQGANLQYQVKNLRIEFGKSENSSFLPVLATSSPTVNYIKDNKLYVKGFLRNLSSKGVSVFIENSKLSFNDGEFEGFLELTPELKQRKFAIIKAVDGNGVLGQEMINFDNLIEADKLFPIEAYPEKATVTLNAKKAGFLKTEGASIVINDSALAEQKEISISRLRRVDVAPMASGMVNVTKGRAAYRFLPDGIRFDKKVSISIEYDEHLIPKGYSAKDIKTFYFNTNTKTWIPVTKDTLNEKEKTVTSLTDHFTDYINGIIQTPESPETAGFTPTMMNDIKAADPSAEITLISPPEVSQTGEANISYPIKIPSGRNGMQPQLTVQYNSDGGSSWLGQGWSINIPSISIDTRWGVPELNATNETEIYTLAGEQLMYPKITNTDGTAVDWMPNRQFDATNSIFSTVPRARIDQAVFTPRKQGSFAKIQRLGSSPSTYYWKVTNTDGTISWYGGKTSALAGAVVKNAAGNIVHWGLYMTEDVNGNNIVYTYYNTPLGTLSSPNENLSGGKVFVISKINYTGFGGQNNGLYEIVFNRKGYRLDSTIDARLGVKMVDCFFLENILIKRTGASSPAIRKYRFDTDYGRFKKGRLLKIAELDKDNKEFYNHAFEYYDDIPKEGTNVFFSAGIEVTACNDELTECVDSDGDGVCNENDNCPEVPGTAENQGCPEAVAGSCREVSFPIPLSNITYKHSLMRRFTLPSENEQCLFAPVRIKDLQIGTATPVSASASNLYLTHYSNAQVANLCPAPVNSYNITAIRNSNFITPAKTWLTSQFASSNVSQINVYNNSQLRRKSNSNPGNYTILDNSVEMDISLLSPLAVFPFDYHLEYQIVGTNPSFLTLDNSDQSEVKTSIYSGTGVSAAVRVNNVILPSSPFNFVTNMNTFISSFKEQYGEQAEITVEDYVVTIRVPNPAIALNTIRVGSVTYNFIDCKDKSLNRINDTADATNGEKNVFKNKLNEVSKAPNNTAFSNQSGNFSYTFGGTIPLNPDCPMYYNYDFLIQGYHPTYDSSLSLLGSSNMKANNLGAYLGLGIGCKWFTKSTTFGYQWTFSEDSSKAKTALVDINGDGLDDIVINEGGYLSFKPHMIERIYDEEGTVSVAHSFGAKKPIFGVDNFYKSVGSSKSGNFQVTFGISKIGGFVGLDKGRSESTSNIYFTDGNGDGLIDVVKNGVVYFNRLDINGNPNFTKDSAITENMVIVAEPMSIEIPNPVDPQPVPNYDVVKVWEAPADGTIKIVNAISLQDVSQEAVATIEMAKSTVSASQCYGMSFPVPKANQPFNMYYFQSGINFSGGCEFWPVRIKNVTLNGGNFSNQIFTASNPNQLLITHGNYTSGLINQCPSYPITAVSPNIDPVTQSLNAATNILNWYDTVVLQSIPHVITECINKSGLQKVGIALMNVNSFTTRFLTPIDLTGSKINSEVYNWSGNGIWIGSHPTEGSLFQSPINNQGTQQVLVGIESNVYINGQLLPGSPFNLFDNPQLFKSALEAQYGATFSFSGPTQASPNTPISFQIFGSQTLSTLKIEPVSQPNQAVVYNFNVSSQCASPRPAAPDRIADTTKWKGIPLSNEAQTIALKRWVADGNEISLPFQENPVTFSFDATGNKKDSTLSGIYTFSKTRDKELWQDSKGNKVESKKEIGSLKAILDFDIEEFYKNTQEGNRISESESRKKAQVEAQSWLDEHYQKQNEKINGRSQARINLQTCSDLPGTMCLLFGTKLNSSNYSVNNTITTATTDCNASGGNLTVKKGDRIYFRIHSNDSKNPIVIWNPRVEYTNTAINTTLDQNSLEIYKSSYSDGFILSANQPLTYPANEGTAVISWPAITVCNPSDMITYKIFKRVITAVENTDDVTVQEIEIFGQDCQVGGITSVSHSGQGISVPVFNGSNPALTSTEFYFKVTSSSNVKWKAFEWKPKIVCTYTTNVKGEMGEPDGTVISNEEYFPIVDYSIYKSHPCSPAYTLVNLSQLPSGVGANPKIYINNAGNNFTNLFTGIENANLWFVVKSNGKAIVKKQITKNSGGINILPNNDPIAIPAGNTLLEIGFYSDDSQVLDDQVSILSKLALSLNSFVRINFSDKPSYDVPVNKINLYQKPNPKFGPMLRQWGQFMYNPKAVQGAISTPFGNLLKENILSFNQEQAAAIKNAVDYINGIGESNMTDTDLGNLETQYASLMNMPFLVGSPSKTSTSTERWIGTHKENYAAATTYRAARMDETSNSEEFGVEEYDFQGMLETGAFAINKISRGDTENLSGGASVQVGSVSVGANASKVLSGNNKSITEYIDFNGDRYPDIVTTDKVQYTNKTGGLMVERLGYGDLSNAKSEGWGMGAQGSYSNGGDKSTTPACSDSSYPRFDGFKGNSGGGISGNFSQGKSIVNRHWLDVNSDGLADLLEKDSNGNVSIRLNLGYSSESAAYKWTVPSAYGKKIFDSNSQNFSAGMGINKWNGSVEAGVSLTSAWHSTENILIDMNGDGLLDYVGTSENINLAVNQGNRFTDFGELTSAFNMERESVNVGSTINGTVTAAITWPLFGFCFKIPAVSLSGTIASTTASKTKKSISDFDGDGYPDLIEDIGNNKLRVHSSNVRRTDKLKMVTNSLKGNFVIDYKVQKVDYNNPDPKWVMSEVVINDGYNKENDGNDVLKKQFVYENGRYDRRERDFYGYETVKTIDVKADQDDNDVVYRTKVSKYHNRSYFLNGLLKESYVLKGDDETKKFSRTENFYELRKLDETNTKMTTNVLSETFDVGGTEGRRSAAVVLVRTKNYLYELNSTPLLTSQTNFFYDDLGRVVIYQNLGDINDPADNYTTKIAYTSHATLVGKHILNVPSSMTIEAPTQIRKRGTTVDNNTGNILTIKSYYTTSESTETKMTYDAYGNLTGVTYPPNDNSQSMFYKYTYDANYYKIIKIQDAFDYTSQMNYYTTDATNHFYYDNGKIIESTDLAGNKTKYEYDYFGRTTKITGPKEDGIKPYTLKFDYYLKYSELNSPNFDANLFVPVAVTSHYDSTHPTNDLQTFTFIDGFARPIQVKKDIELNIGSPTAPNMVEHLSVSGTVFYDEFGRAAKEYHPYYQTKDLNTQFLLLEHDTQLHALTEYDELDRPVRSLDAEQNESTMTYSIEQDNFGTTAMKTKTVVSQIDNQEIISEVYKDVSGRVISTMNLGGDELWTKFDYNPIGELMEYKDAGGMITSYNYDMFGRKLDVTHPDNGITSFVYDKASNLTKIQTNNLMVDNSLAPEDRFIKYFYDYNRVSAIMYPDTPSGVNISNVYYEYGASTLTGADAHKRGRLTRQKDATGEQLFEYGNMGEVTKNTRIVAGPNIPTRLFEMVFDYDSFNRLLHMVYPDGERLFYNYDLGGNLLSIKNSNDYHYIKRIDYDYFEQRKYLLYGNNTETFYTYTETLRRLKNLNVKTSNQQDLFFNNYKYDKIGNVTELLNTAVPNTTMGGRYSHYFTYDNLNRLDTASGEFNGDVAQGSLGNDFQSNYSTRMIYNNTHGITEKRQEHFKNNVPHVPNTYRHVYKYEDGTHKVREVFRGTTLVESMDYDRNGNITARSKQGQPHVYFWDESNRLRVVMANHNMQHYIYDASGERVLKASSDSESVYENGSLTNPSSININSYTTYPSAFMVIDPNGIYSKHYYAGTQRIVSRLGESAKMFDLKEKKAAVTKSDNEAFDDEALRQRQITDLQKYLDAAKLGKATFKEYKGTTYQEEEQILKEEALEDEDMESNPEVKRALDPSAPIYYYHPDHLGTSTFLTDANGNPYQFFLNLPFGETMAEQLPSSYYKTPFKFSGKEMDEETGLHYFGARYYDSRISIWMSVDPLVEQTMDAYGYCYQNPIRFIDPDGMQGQDVVIIGKGRDKAFEQLQSSTKMELKMDDKGKVTTNSSPENYADQQLLSAIIDKNVTVQLNAHSELESEEGGILADSFNGNLTRNDKTLAFQEINVDVAERMDAASEVPGALVKHAVVEAFIGGLIARDRHDIRVTKATQADKQNPNSIYSMAHEAAPYQGAKGFVQYGDPRGNSGRIYVLDKNGKQVNIQTWPKKMEPLKK